MLPISLELHLSIKRRLQVLILEHLKTFPVDRVLITQLEETNQSIKERSSTKELFQMGLTLVDKHLHICSSSKLKILKDTECKSTIRLYRLKMLKTQGKYLIFKILVIYTCQDHWSL